MFEVRQDNAQDTQVGELFEPIEASVPASTEPQVTYHQQVSYCGKARCRKCKEGVGHGPYWYAYRNVKGRTVRTYIGKQLPPDLQDLQEADPTGLNEARLKISLLGQFQMERRSSHEWNPVADAAWQHQRVRSLLACLLSSPGRKLGREQVIDALWPELDLDIGIDRLNRAVHSLRQVFEPSRSRPATSHLLRTEREMLILADQAQIWTDADAFDGLIGKAHSTGNADEAEKLLIEADKLYGGMFLPEEQEALWAVARRDALQRNWIGLLLELSDLRIKAEDLNAAVKTLDKLFTVDPENEAAVQRLIILLSQMGRRSEALQAYKRLASALKNNYDIEPLPETRAFYEAIRSGEALNLEAAQGLAMTLQPPNITGANLPRPELLIGRRHQGKLV
ncbi:MAG TPA: DUF6788 family protein, partial [Ktedonobacteraceae bacterium]|nr:DUF6788 family protein [Ktedonobacteraceae bacterium]